MRTALLALVTLAAAAGPAAAADGAALASSGGYWRGFLDHWTAYFGKQSGVVMVALLVGAASLLIITRGKWKK